MALALAAGLLLGKHSSRWEWAAAGAAAAGLAVLLGLALRRKRWAAGILALVLCLGAVYGWHVWHGRLPAAGVRHVRGVVAEEVREGTGSQHKTVLQQVTLDGQPLAGGAYWTFYGDEVPESLAPGALVEGDLSLYHPGGADNPGGFDFREYLLQRGIRVGVYGRENLRVTPGVHSLAGWTAALRSSLAASLQRVMGEEAGGYAATMLLGLRTLMPGEDRAAFNRLGIGHVLSVSGFHVGILYLLLNGLLTALQVPRRARFPLHGVLLGFYCLLTGGGAAVIRAAVLLLLREWAYLRGRPTEPLHLLGGAAILTLLIRPAQVTAAGFHLTYGALLGLTLVTPLLLRARVPGLRHEPPRWLARIGRVFAATLGAQAGILLPLLYWYQELPLLSLLLNGLVLGVSSLVLGLYWLVFACMGVPVLGAFLGDTAARVTGALSAGVRALASLEGIVLWVPQANLLTALGWVLLLAGLAWLWHLTGRQRLALAGAGLLILVLSLIPWPHRGTEWVQLSVGSADAAVLRDGETVWVIDAGEDSTLSTYLHQRRLSVDTLVLTHLHRDHVLGVEALLDDRIPIRRVVLAEGAELPALHEDVPPLLERLLASGAEVVRVSRGSVLPLPSGRVTVLWPEAGKIRPDTDANHSSMALLFELQGTRFLTTGDLTARYEHYSAVPADILKLAHHGSRESDAAEYLEAVGPRVLLLSGGDETRLALSREKAGDIPLWSTLEQGALNVVFHPGGYGIEGFLTQN